MRVTQAAGTRIDAGTRKPLSDARLHAGDNAVRVARGMFASAHCDLEIQEYGSSIRVTTPSDALRDRAKPLRHRELFKVIAELLNKGVPAPTAADNAIRPMS